MDASAYDEWHSNLSIDLNAESIWHTFVKNALEERDTSAKKLLDIGCGRGGFACWLAQCEPPPDLVTAADYSPVAVEQGRTFSLQHAIDRIEWRVEDIQAISFPDNTFDTVISCETIEHVPDPAKAVTELARVLRPGGRLLLTTPNYFSVTGLYRGYLRLVGRKYTEEGQPINNFMHLLGTMQLVRRANLRITKFDAVGHYFLFPGHVPSRIHFMDRLRFLSRFTGLHSFIIAEKPL